MKDWTIIDWIFTLTIALIVLLVVSASTCSKSNTVSYLPLGTQISEDRNNRRIK